MKTKAFLAMAALAIFLGPVGCTPSTTPPQALAPGYLNAADQQMGEILAGAHSFYVTIQNQSAQGTMTLTPTQKQAFNTFGLAINAAQTVYLAYHNGTATQADAQAAVNAVQTQQAALPQPAVNQ